MSSKFSNDCNKSQRNNSNSSNRMDEIGNTDELDEIEDSHDKELLLLSLSSETNVSMCSICSRPIEINIIADPICNDCQLYEQQQNTRLCSIDPGSSSYRFDPDEQDHENNTNELMNCIDSLESINFQKNSKQMIIERQSNKISSSINNSNHMNTNSNHSSSTMYSNNCNIHQRLSRNVPKLPIAKLNMSSYKFIKEISYGAYSTVFLAKKKTNKQFYAIKVLNRPHLKSWNMEKSIEKEIMLLDKCQKYSHQFVKFYGTSSSCCYDYIVMEYLSTGDCLTAITRKSFSIELVRKVIVEVVHAIISLHDHAIVHRDIKPDNIMITSTGHVKITDFSLSFLCPTLYSRLSSKALAWRLSEDEIDDDDDMEYNLEENEDGDVVWTTNEAPPSSLFAASDINSPLTTSMATTTEDHSISATSLSSSSLSYQGLSKSVNHIGSYLYCSPEIHNNEICDYMVDWWAVAILCFHLLHGNTPFDSPNSTQVDVIARIKAQQFDWVFYKDCVVRQLSKQYSNDVIESYYDFLQCSIGKEMPDRLGYEDSYDILQHPFISGVDYNKLISDQNGPFYDYCQKFKSSIQDTCSLADSDLLITLDMLENDVKQCFEEGE